MREVSATYQPTATHGARYYDPQVSRWLSDLLRWLSDFVRNEQNCIEATVETQCIASNK